MQHDNATAGGCLLSKGSIEHLQMLRKELTVSWKKYFTTYDYNNNSSLLLLLLLLQVIPVKVNYNYFTLFKASSLNLKIKKG